MDSYLSALEANNTWSIISLPPVKSPIDCKWVYKLKFRVDGTLERYKARLVARGFTQRVGIDYVETFSPVAKLFTIKTLLSLAAIFGWHLSHLDFHNAFFHGDLQEEVYMSSPPGHHSKRECLSSNPVCKLNKSLYGLKQASRQWFCKFSTALLQAGFIQSFADSSLFIKKSDIAFIALLVCVDDIVISSDNMEAVQELKDFLSNNFKIKDLGNLSYFLGLEVARSKTRIMLSQRYYALQILSNTGFL